MGTYNYHDVTKVAIPGNKGSPLAIRLAAEHKARKAKWEAQALDLQRARLPAPTPQSNVPSPHPPVPTVQCRRICPELIQGVTAKHFGVDGGRDALIGPRRFVHLTYARHVAVYVTSVMTGRSTPDIARRFKKRDHTTIINSIRRIASMVGDKTHGQDVKLNPQTCFDVAAIMDAVIEISEDKDCLSLSIQAEVIRKRGEI